MAEAVRVPATVKTRLGWCGSAADPVGWCRRLQDAGAQMLTLHGRTRVQVLKSHADWRAIAAVKQGRCIPDRQVCVLIWTRLGHEPSKGAESWLCGESHSSGAVPGVPLALPM